MIDPTRNLKPENVIKRGDGLYVNIPRVLDIALKRAEWRLFPISSGMTSFIHLCTHCADELAWPTEHTDPRTNIKTSGVCRNVAFRTMVAEDRYMIAHCYQRTERLEEADCSACVWRRSGFPFTLCVDFIFYTTERYVPTDSNWLKAGDLVEVCGMKGRATGGLRNLFPEFTEYHIKLKNGSDGYFLHWQIRKIKETK